MNLEISIECCFAGPRGLFEDGRDSTGRVGSGFRERSTDLCETLLIIRDESRRGFGGPSRGESEGAGLWRCHEDRLSRLTWVLWQAPIPPISWKWHEDEGRSLAAPQPRRSPLGDCRYRA